MFYYSSCLRDPLSGGHGFESQLLVNDFLNSRLLVKHVRLTLHIIKPIEVLIDGIAKSYLQLNYILKYPNVKFFGETTIY